MYMDDLLTGSDSIEDGKLLAYEIDLLLRNGGFELRHWGSNSGAIQDMMRGDGTTVDLGEDEETKILGLRWLKPTDQLTIFVRPMEAPATLTKRGILSEIARLYDPNGLIGPVIVAGKVLMQDIWRIKDLNWDTPVPVEIRERWLDFSGQLPHLSKFRVPRWLCTGENWTIQLHGFCDASESAYGAVLYIRAENNITGRICRHTGVEVSCCAAEIAQHSTIRVVRSRVIGKVNTADSDCVQSAYYRLFHVVRFGDSAILAQKIAVRAQNVCRK